MLVVISCGNPLPARKYQPTYTKAELQYKTDTKTLEDVLAKLMNVRDDIDHDELAAVNQGKNYSCSV